MRNKDLRLPAWEAEGGWLHSQRSLAASPGRGFLFISVLTLRESPLLLKSNTCRKILLAAAMLHSLLSPWPSSQGLTQHPAGALAPRADLDPSRAIAHPHWAHLSPQQTRIPPLLLLPLNCLPPILPPSSKEYPRLRSQLHPCPSVSAPPRYFPLQGMVLWLPKQQGSLPSCGVTFICYSPALGSVMISLSSKSC